MGKVVLLVTADDVCRETITRSLARQRYRVMVAAAVRAALGALEAVPADLLIVDTELAGVDSLLQLARADPRLQRLPILLLGQSYRHVDLASIPKPIAPITLAAIVQGMIGDARQRPATPVGLSYAAVFGDPASTAKPDVD